MTRCILIRSAATTLTVTAALLLAACSSSGNSANPEVGSGGGNSMAAANSQPSVAPSEGKSAGKSVTDYLAYTHGTSGKADPSLSPVVIGWLNQQGGQQEIGADTTKGAEMAVKYINAELGGVGGHPVKLKECFIRSSSEEGATCAQQMLASKAVKVIATGAVAIGIQAFYSTLNGAKPVIDMIAVTPVDTVQKNVVIYQGDVTHVLPPTATYAKKVLHAKSASLIYPNIPGLTDGAKAFKAAFNKVGIPLKVVSFDESDPDLIGPITSSGASSADVVIPYTNAASCANLAKGLQQLGITNPKKIVAEPLCLTSAVAKGLGGDYPHWTYATASSLYGDTSDPAVAAYRKVANKYTTKGIAADTWTMTGFSQILTIDGFFNELGYGKITSKDLLAKAKAFTGPLALGAPGLQCGKYPKTPAVCADSARFMQYDGHNKWTQLSGWLQPPP